MVKRYVHGKELFRYVKYTDDTDERGPGGYYVIYAFMEDGKVLKQFKQNTAGRITGRGWKLAEPKDKMPTEQFAALLESEGYSKEAAS
jgi:hypothetical protein